MFVFSFSKSMDQFSFKVAAQLSRCVEEVKFVVDSKPLLDDLSCTLDVDQQKPGVIVLTYIDFPN